MTTAAVDNNTRRRDFLALAAAAATTVMAARPALATTRPADPILAAIEVHKQAVDAVDVAVAEIRRILTTAKERVGDDSISLLDMREPSSPPGFHPEVRVGFRNEIEVYVPQAAHPELHQFYMEALKQQSKVYADCVASLSPGGDLDSVLGDLPQVEWAAAEALAEIAPTTTAGVLALLAHVGDALTRESSLADEQLLTELVGSLAASAKTLRDQFA